MPQRYRHLAEYYDAEYVDQRMLKHDVPFFLGQLPKRRQTILELCAGTGRAVIPIAKAGHRVVGIDYAPDMLDLARRKRDAAGLSERQLKLISKDVLKLDLKQKFDWVCIFFNTFLSFATPQQQDRLLGIVRAHLNPRGRFWLDIFNPDLSLIANPKLDNVDPGTFFVPSLRRTVHRTVSLRRTGPQVERCTFHYLWFDDAGREHREKTSFDLTFLFERELRLLLERNGLRIEKLWGNYDGSALTVGSPRMIARCCRM
jgi:SAM-dependent methyltransferase